MTIVHLVRHASHAEIGRVLSGRSEIGLNEAGRREADRLSARLSGQRLRRIQSSPRRRARETAEIIAAPHALAVELVDALDEVDFGAWAGRGFGELDGDPAWQRWNAARGHAVTPGGETMAAATARVRDHLATLDEAEPVLCVSHCDVIRGAVASYLGLDLDRILAFDCDPASCTTLVLWPGGGRVASLNEHAA